jgi:hypothetical protein
MRVTWHFQLIGTVVLYLCTPPALCAQAGPAIHGFNGTLATEGTIKDEYKATHKIVVETADGVDHVYNVAKGVLIHGGKNDLSDLKPGTTVVIHYTADATGKSAHEIDRVGTNGLSEMEGMVTKMDRAKKEITVRYDNGTTEKLTLTDRAAVDAGQDFRNAPPGTTRIVVYYSEEAGHKIAHYFRQKN